MVKYFFQIINMIISLNLLKFTNKEAVFELLKILLNKNKIIK